VQALRELLDNPEREDWDELAAANRALISAFASRRPMTRRNARIVAEYLREAGWGEGNTRRCMAALLRDMNNPSIAGAPSRIGVQQAQVSGRDFRSTNLPARRVPTSTLRNSIHTGF
jgi:hypothetical protein